MPKKQTSPRLSSAAARLLALIPKNGTVDVWGPRLGGVHRHIAEIPADEIRSLLASLVSQDEQRGQKPKKKPKGKGRVVR